MIRRLLDHVLRRPKRLPLTDATATQHACAAIAALGGRRG